MAVSKFTPDRTEAFIRGIERGLSYALTCSLIGIELNTFTSWRMRGEEDLEREDELETPVARGSSSPYAKFVLDVRAAESVTMNTWLDAIDGAATSGNWQAAAWRLKMRYPDEFGDRVKTEMSGPNGGPIETRQKIQRIEVHKSSDKIDPDE